jgi:hypothetical protein
LRRRRKGRELEEEPTHILNSFKKVEDRSINEKDHKKVEQMAKKNGPGPAFMAETFGVEKDHNPEVFNAIIDKHNHVDRWAVKALFSQAPIQKCCKSYLAKNQAWTSKAKEPNERPLIIRNNQKISRC